MLVPPVRELVQDLGERIDRSRWQELLADLVATPSHPGVPRQEEGVVRRLAAFLAAEGIVATLDEVAPGRPNLVATIAAARPGRRLLLCAHTDTVPLNADDPGVGFSAAVRDGRLCGRGAVDMKGAVAAMAAVLVALDGSGALGAGSVTLAAVVDEEMESLGAERLVRSGLRADGAIVGEPTENRLALGHKGLEWLEVELVGRAAHGGTPGRGVNAIAAAGRLLGLIETELAPRLAVRAHPLLGAPTLNVGTIRGGDQPSTVAARCVLAADRRLVPAETADAAIAELAELCGRVAASFPGLAWNVRRQPGGMATFAHGPLLTPAEHPLAAAVAAAAAAVRGRREEPVAFPAWTDGALLANEAGIPTVVLGPGDLALAHGPDESVPLAEVGEAARIYALSALAFCGDSVVAPRHRS
jgi:acetylornithine deacetylase/succinyl-diaminopimelate desuccinylase